jgi:hypothetical protein
VQLTGHLSLKSQGEPLIHTTGDSESADLSLEGADGFVLGDILIEAFEDHVVTNVLHIELESLVPDRGLSSVLLDDSLEAGLSELNNAEGIHFAHELGVSSQFGLHDRDL